MPDICMCQSESCPKRNSCYRFLATPDQYQSYFMGMKWDEEKGCEYYWEIDLK